MRNQFCVLVRRLRIRPLRRHITKIFPMLPLTPRKHINRLLADVKVVLLKRCRRAKIEIPIHKRLGFLLLL